jgi:hypothetical protein
MVAAISPLNAPSRQGRGSPSPGRSATHGRSLTERPGNTGSASRFAAILVCPACYKKLRWHHRWPGRAVCPACGLRLVVLWDPTRRFSASAENEDSLSEMICDWLDEEDSESEVAQHSCRYKTRSDD